MELEPVIGLEVHVQLKTKSKMFCRCDNRDDQEPNTAICPVCTGQPGALPVPNQQAIDWAVMTALALGCRINQKSKFDRKSYFYPDLPKGYQISQYDLPFGEAGKVTVAVNGELMAFRIHRLHLEEDAGKLIHPAGQDYSLVDLNRTGTPLMEIVSEPDFHSPAEAKAYLEQLRLVMRYLGVSDADMEKGHLRCDANVSLRPRGEEKLYPKTEIKNMNSFRAVERGLAYEIERQTGLWEEGKAPTVQSTRGWDESTGTTKEQRIKEEAADYRYFPEPDIPPVIISDERLQEIRDTIPEMPNERVSRYVEQYQLTTEMALGLVGDKELADYFEEVVSEINGLMAEEEGAEKAGADVDESGAKINQQAANFLVNKITGEHRAEHGLIVSAENMAELLQLLRLGKVNASAASKIYEAMAESGGKKSPRDLVDELGLEQMSDTGELDKVVDAVINANEKVVGEYRQGKTAALQFLVGQVMKETKGKANPQVVQEIFKKSLG